MPRACREHSNCERCRCNLEFWKRKATQHGYNAQRLKYSLMCLMDDLENQIIIFSSERDTSHSPITLGMDAVPTEEDNFQNWECGICKENHSKVGAHRPVIFNCSHTICASCYSKHALPHRSAYSRFYLSAYP